MAISQGKSFEEGWNLNCIFKLKYGIFLFCVFFLQLESLLRRIIQLIPEKEKPGEEIFQTTHLYMYFTSQFCTHLGSNILKKRQKLKKKNLNT